MWSKLACQCEGTFDEAPGLTASHIAQSEPLAKEQANTRWWFRLLREWGGDACCGASGRMGQSLRQPPHRLGKFDSDAHTSIHLHIILALWTASCPGVAVEGCRAWRCKHRDMALVKKETSLMDFDILKETPRLTCASWNFQFENCMIFLSYEI